MKPLDLTQQRVLGVLIEKELSVPESYPLTENSLQAGCNQKSNRDPLMTLEEYEIHGTVLGLQQDGWVGRTERDGGRTTRFKHLVEARLGLDNHQKAVLAELLVRGPQTPMELKNRVSRMGFETSAEQIEAMLKELKDKNGRPLVEQLPKAPRERDQRWAHTLGPRAAGQGVTGPETVAASPSPVESPSPASRASMASSASTSSLTSGQAGKSGQAGTSGQSGGEETAQRGMFEERLAALEARVAALEQQLREARVGPERQ